MASAAENFSKEKCSCRRVDRRLRYKRRSKRLERACSTICYAIELHFLRILISNFAILFGSAVVRVDEGRPGDKHGSFSDWRHSAAPSASRIQSRHGGAPASTHQRAGAGHSFFIYYAR